MSGRIGCRFPLLPDKMELKRLSIELTLGLFTACNEPSNCSVETRSLWVWMDNCRPRYSSTGCMNGKLCLKGVLVSLIKSWKFISRLEQLPWNVFGIHEGGKKRKAGSHSWEAKGMIFAISKTVCLILCCLILDRTPSKAQPVLYAIHTLELLCSNDSSLSLLNHCNLI